MPKHFRHFTNRVKLHLRGERTDKETYLLQRVDKSQRRRRGVSVRSFVP